MRRNRDVRVRLFGRAIDDYSELKKRNDTFNSDMLDEKDKIVLEYLLHDCRISLPKLAKATGVTKSSVYQRISKMEKNGIIEKYDAILDYKKFPLDLSFIFISVDGEQKERFEVSMKNSAEVDSIFHTYHRRNYILHIVTKDESHLKKFLSKLSSFSVKYSVYRYQKMSFLPFSLYDVPVNIKKEKPIDMSYLLILSILSY